MADHTALIVGGTSGIGLATARRLLDRGAAVHVAGRSKERISAVTATDPGLHGHQADGSRAEQIAALAETIGRIDWLIITLSGGEGAGHWQIWSWARSGGRSTPSSGGTSPPSRPRSPGWPLLGPSPCSGRSRPTRPCPARPASPRSTGR